MNEEAVLERLRGIFRGELVDQIAVLERGGVVLERRDSPLEARRHAVLEIYRAAHSLKGAARAVGFEDIEHRCHALESTLSPLRGSSLSDGDGELDNALHELRELIFWLEDWQREHFAEPAQSPPQPQAAAPEPTTLAPTPEPLDSIRVARRRVDALIRHGEGLLGTVDRAERVDFAVLADCLEELGRRLAQLGRTSRELGDRHSRDNALAAVEAARNAVQTASLWSFSARQSQVRAWQSTRQSARRLADAARQLGLVELRVLEPLLERTAIDTARTLGRRVVFELTGGGVEIDRHVLERLRDPLVHLIRNAVDHGFEPPQERRERGKRPEGQLRVTATSSAAEFSIRIADDGRGLDPQALLAAAAARGLEVAGRSGNAIFELAFEPGLTTRDTVSETSGRGIGLDVVKQHVSELGGRITVTSTAGAGTEISMSVPLSLRALRILPVTTRGASFGLHEAAVVRVVRLAEDDIVAVEGAAYTHLEGALLPIADLGDALELPQRRASERIGKRVCLLLAAGDRRFGLLVDDVRPVQDAVVQRLGARIRRVPLIASVTVLAGDLVVPVLDNATLLAALRPAATARATAPAPRRRRVLVADDSVTTRELLRSILQLSGFEVAVASDGAQALRSLAAESFDGVVSDVEMPHMDGFQLLGRLRSSPRTARLPVVLVTALSREEDRRRAAELGADAYIVKSTFDQETLLDLLHELIP